jgi:glycogen debranching enzyme
MQPDPFEFPFTAQTRNLVRFCRHLPHETLDASFAGAFAFRDAGSRFMVLKSVRTAPGPDECWGVFARDGRLLFRKLLGLELEYVGLARAQRAGQQLYNSMNYYRSHLEEHFCHNGCWPEPPLAGQCELWFPEPDVLRIRYTLRATARVPVRVRLQWFAEGEPGLDCAARVVGAGFEFRSRAVVSRCEYTARAKVQSAVPGLRFRARGCVLRSAWLDSTVPAAGEQTFDFLVRFAFNREAWPARRAAWTRTGTLRQSVARMEAAYARLPELPAAVRPHAPLVLKAAGTLLTLRYDDRTVRGPGAHTIHAGKVGCACTWFWDSAISLLGLGLMGDRRTAAGVITLLTDGIRADGTPPCTYEAGAYKYSYQIPILAWGVGHYLALQPDRALAARVYPALARYVRNWLGYAQPATGLVVYPAGSTALDDALRWTEGFPLEPAPGTDWTRQEWGRMRQDLFESADVNAFLALEAASLAAIARSLGRRAEAEDWDAVAARIKTAVNRHLYDPRTGVYQDRHVETGRFTGLVNLGSFIPFYAGCAPRAVAAAAGRRYLLSPDHFLTPFPFPVVDRAHPTYRPGGFLYAPPQFPGSLVHRAYWRGRTWIHGNYWLLGALWQAGLRREADRLAGVTLEGVGRNEAICECYDSLTGYPNGHNEFMWSSAAVLALAYRHYRNPPVGRASSPSFRDRGA